jgi:outer membrane protein TolC
MGRTPSDIPGEAAVCQAPPRLAQPLPVGDGAALLRRRPDLREADRNLAAATARIGVAVSQLYPQITLGGSVTDLASTTQGLKSPSAVAFSVGPLISWSFPNIAVARSHIAESQAQASAALASFDSAVLQALKEAEQALTGYNAERLRHVALEAAARQAAEAYRLADVQYRAGTASFLDLLSAQASLIQAQQALAASDLALASDQVTVFRALGGGWENAPPVKAPKAP